MFIYFANFFLVDAWIKKKNLRYLGMPRYIGSGSHECKGQKYRFVVMERFGKDLWSLFLESERVFPVATVFRIAHQVVSRNTSIYINTFSHSFIKNNYEMSGFCVKLA